MKTSHSVNGRRAPSTLRGNVLVALPFVLLLGCDTGEAECHTAMGTGYFVWLECDVPVSSNQPGAVSVRIRPEGTDSWAECPVTEVGRTTMTCGEVNGQSPSYSCTNMSEAVAALFNLDRPVRFEIDALFRDSDGATWKAMSKVTWKDTGGGCPPNATSLTLDMSKLPSE